jgi:hypothetical protein
MELAIIYPLNEFERRLDLPDWLVCYCRGCRFGQSQSGINQCQTCTDAGECGEY